MADCTAGETFVDGQLVSAARLNHHVTGLTILPDFVSAKPTLTPVGTDRILTWHTTNILNAPTVTQVLALQVVDAAPNVGSMRTLGTGANQAAPGDTSAQLAASNTFTGTAQTVKHLGSNPSGAGITIAAGAGLVTPTVLNIAGTDLVGRINVTPASTTGTSAVLFTVTYGTAYSGAPNVMLLPRNGAALTAFQTAGKYVVVTTETTTTFVVSSGTTALSSGVAYQFSYVVIRG